MHSILVFGAGKIGSLLAYMLSTHGNYKVYLADQDFGLFRRYIGDNSSGITLLEHDIGNSDEILKSIKKHEIKSVISALPFYLTLEVAKIARSANINYFDLTEDVANTSKLQELSKGSDTAFVPQCGLAPGVVGLVANHLMQKFDSVDSVNLRVGALPQFTNNDLKYAMTWSTDGLINEYLNPCICLKDGKLAVCDPLDDLESIVLDGLEYEAFNTSGGLGSLAELNVAKVSSMNYKSIRYQGHVRKFMPLIEQFGANKDISSLKEHLDLTLPTTEQDVVIIYVKVTGLKNTVLKDASYYTKIYPTKINNIPATAIQIATSAGICGIVDIVLQEEGKYQGFVNQEMLSFDKFMSNKFGQYYK